MKFLIFNNQKKQEYPGTYYTPEIVLAVQILCVESPEKNRNICVF